MHEGEQMDRIGRSAINAVTSAGGYVVPAIITFITTPILIHYVGKAAYGINGLANTILGYFLIMDMGMDIALVKYLAEDNARNDFTSSSRLLNSTFQLYSLIGLVGMFAIIALSGFLARVVFSIPEEMIGTAKLVFILSGVGFFVSAMNMWIRGAAQGIQRYDFVGSSNVLTIALGNFSGIILVVLGYGLVGYVLARVVSSMTVAAFFFIVIKKKFPHFHFKFRFERRGFSRIWSYTAYGLVLRISGMIFGRLDEFFIGMWIGAAAVGVYSIPLLIMTYATYLIGNTLHFLFPMASELHSLDNFAQLRETLHKGTKFLAAFTCMVFIPVIVFGDSFLKLWVGADIAMEARQVFLFLLASGFLSTIFVTNINAVTVGIGKIRPFATYILTKGLINAVLFFILIKRYGIEGGGMTLLASSAVDLVFAVIVIKRFFKTSAHKFFIASYLMPVMDGLFLGVVFFMFRSMVVGWFSLCLAVALFEILYVLLGFVTKVFGDIEKAAVRSMLSLITQRA